MPVFRAGGDDLLKHALAKATGVAADREAAIAISAAERGTADGKAAAIAHARARATGVAAAREAAAGVSAAIRGTADGTAAEIAHALTKAAGVTAATDGTAGGEAASKARTLAKAGGQSRPRRAVRQAASRCDKPVPRQAARQVARPL